MECGTNRLLKKGGILVTEAKDIIDNIQELTYEKVTEKALNPCLLSPDYLPVYQAITKKEMDVNALSKCLKMPVKEINRILFMLELENYVEKLPGGEYRIKEE